MTHLVAVTREQVAQATRALPRIRGHGRLSALLNSMFLSFGCAPLAMAPMRLGYEMLIDTRSRTERNALYSGDYDTYKIRFLMHLMRYKSVFVDVGANIGFYTVPLARCAETLAGRVFAFEPHPANFSRLRYNLRRNGLDAVVSLLQVGLSSGTREAELTIREDFACGAQTGNAAIFTGTAADRSFPTVPISLSSLDELYGVEIRRVDIIKVDIEGHEDMFMLGARRTISRERPIIMAEVNQFYYRPRGIDLFARLAASVPSGYGIYLPTSRWRRRLAVGDGFDALKRAASFEGCAEIDTAFMIPDEKLQMALDALKT